MTNRLSSAYESGKTGLNYAELQARARAHANQDFDHGRVTVVKMTDGAAKGYYMTTYWQQFCARGDRAAIDSQKI